MYKWIEYYNKIYKKHCCTVRSAVTLKRLYCTFLSFCVNSYNVKNSIAIFVMYRKELLQLTIVGVLYFLTGRLLMCLVKN